MRDSGPGLFRPAWWAALVVACILALSAAAQPVPTSLDAFGLLVAVQSRPSFTILGAGARAAGMGGAFTALADDASAASFNPAGLALLVKPETSLVLDGRRRRDQHAAFEAVEDGVLERFSPSRTSFDSQAVNFASFTVPLVVAERNLCFQLSYHRLIDFTFEGDRRLVESPADGGPDASLRQTIDQDGELYTLSLAAAYQLTQRLSLGLTLSRWSGQWSFATRTAEREPGEERESVLRFTQANDWSGWNATLGLLLRYRYLNVGATFRSAFDGDFRVASALETSFPSPFEPSSRLDGTLRWPGSWTVGVAIKPLETWFLTADYAEFDWDDMVIEGLADEPVSFFDLQPQSRSTTRNTGQWRFGTEHTFFAGDHVLAARGGYFEEPRPQLLAPSDEKSSIRGISLGAGWKRGPVSVDLAYQRSSTTTLNPEFVDPDMVARGVVSPQAAAEVDTREERWFLSFLYQFEPRETLRKLGHFLFVGPLEKAPEPAGGEGEGNGEADGS